MLAGCGVDCGLLGRCSCQLARPQVWHTGQRNKYLLQHLSTSSATQLDGVSEPPTPLAFPQLSGFSRPLRMQKQPEPQPNSLPPVAHKTRVLSIPQLNRLTRSLVLLYIPKRVGLNCRLMTRLSLVVLSFSQLVCTMEVASTTRMQVSLLLCIRLDLSRRSRSLMSVCHSPKILCSPLRPESSSLSQGPTSPRKS